MSWQDKELLRNYKNEPVPQHWGGNDWKITGIDNPLPVANYTQSEKGIWLPTSKENPVPTQLTGSIVELYEDAVEVPAGSRAEPMGVGRKIPNNIKKINILVNTSSDDWSLVIRFSAGGSSASANSRIEFVYPGENLRKYTDDLPLSPQRMGRSYVVNRLPRLGRVHSYYFENESDSDLDMQIRIEGVV